MPTEIQKVPGTFTLPAGWPRLVIPDTKTGIYADFDAASLPLGRLNGRWESNAGTVPFALTNRNNPANPSDEPVVTVDSNGNQRVTFDGTNRLDSTPNPFPAMPAQITILATIRPTWFSDPNDAQSHVRIVTGPGNAYRSIQLNWAVPGQYLAAGTPGSAQVTSTRPLGQLTQAAARFGAATIQADVYGAGTAKAAATGTLTTQTGLFLGANGEGSPLGHFKGDFYRVQIWSRVLNDTDLAAAMAENAERFNIS